MDKNDIIKQQAAIIEALQKENTQLKDTYKKTQTFVENQKFEIEYLKADVALLQNKKYGKSSDKITKDNYNLFNMDVINEVEINQETPEEEPIEIEEICYDDRYVRFMKKIIDRDTISSLELLNKMDFINYAIKNNRVLAIVTKKQEVEDFKLSKEELEAVDIMRKALNGMKSDEALENILNMFAHTKDNKEFVQTVKKQRFLY